MKRSANYETNNGVIQVRPNMVQTKDGVTYKPSGEPEFAYLTIFTNTSKIHVNKEYVRELIEILEALEARYITKTE